MTTATKTRRTTRATKGHPPTLGPLVCEWIIRYCVLGAGDHFGEPFKLTRWQKKFLYELYELKSDGTRRYRRALLGLPKGNGKTPIAAAVAAVELAGPVVFDGWNDDGTPRGKQRTSPDIPIGAASYQQADLVYEDLSTMFRESAILPQFVDVFEKKIVLKEPLTGEAYKVAAAAGTNDGKRPTCFVADELHEWRDAKERVHLVLENGCAKRDQSLSLAITTAGFDKGSLCYKLYTYGQKVATGEVNDPAFLFWWVEAADTWDLDDDDELRAAIRQANPAADDFVDVEAIAARYHQMPRHEFLRYHLNQWVDAETAWLPADAWQDCADDTRSIADGAPVMLGFDGSRSGDCTALVVCSLEDRPHVQVVKCWENPGTDPDWTVPVTEVMQAIREACAKWKVKEIAADQYIWTQALEQLADEGYPIVAMDQSRGLVRAAQRFYEAVITKALTHADDPRLNRHIANVIPKYDTAGTARPSRNRKVSGSFIDLAVAAMQAFDRVTVAALKPKARVRFYSFD